MPPKVERACRGLHPIGMCVPCILKVPSQYLKLPSQYVVTTDNPANQPLLSLESSVKTYLRRM